MSQHGRKGGYHSLFWPVVFIGVGAVLLLDNLGAFPAGVNWGELIGRFWPMILILIGVDILFGRSSSALGRLIGAALALALVGAVILLAFVSPVSSVTQSRRTVPGDGVERATLDVNFEDYNGTIETQRSSTNLVEADLTAYGDLDFSDDQSGGVTEVSIAPMRGDNWWEWLNPSRWFNGGDRDDLKWTILLKEGVRFETMTLSMEDGRYNFDLARVNLAGLTIKGDNPTIDLRLPATLREGRIEVDDGPVTIRLPELSSDVGLQIRVKLHDGSVDNQNRALERTRLDGTGGVWETSNFDEADQKVRLEINAEDARVRFE